jgi:hypothetical protein
MTLAGIGIWLQSFTRCPSPLWKRLSPSNKASPREQIIL